MKYTGELAAIITAVLWSFTSIFFSESAKRIGSIQLNINRLIIASSLLFSAILIGGYDYHISNSQIIFLVCSGFIGLVLGDAFLFKSYIVIGPSFAILLMALSPGMSSVLGYIFLGESLSPLTIAGILVTITGVTIAGTENKKKEDAKYHLTFKGIIFGILSALGQASGLIFAKQAFNIGEINGFVAAFFRVFSSAVIMLPILLILKKYKNPVNLFRENQKALAYTAAGSFTGPFLGITCSLIAVSNTHVGIAATLMSTMPILMIPLMWILYKERPTTRGLIGTIIAVLGVALLFVK